MLPDLAAFLPHGLLSAHFAGMAALVFGAALTQGIGGIGFAMVSAPISVLPGPIVDTMGAGDSTLSSLIAELVREGAPASAHGWKAALDRAMDVAAATCRAEGALLRQPGEPGVSSLDRIDT